MSRRLLISALLAICALTAVAVAQGEIFQKGNLRIKVSGGLSPHALPRERLAPVTARVTGQISTTDGTHPPALKKLEIGLNRNGRLSTVGLPTCTSNLLQSTTTAQALKRCGPARVGHGHFSADVSLPSAGSFPASGDIVAFNGRQGGRQALLLHLYGVSPVRVTFVLPLLVSQRQRGEFGAVLSARVPTLAGGLGSISEIDLELGRNYTYRGQPRSYLSASCAAPAGFTVAPFIFARGNFLFADGRRVETKLSRSCTVR
jgi:hypothetical protein